MTSFLVIGNAVLLLKKCAYGCRLTQCDFLTLKIIFISYFKVMNSSEMLPLINSLDLIYAHLEEYCCLLCRLCRKKTFLQTSKACVYIPLKLDSENTMPDFSNLPREITIY